MDNLVFGTGEYFHVYVKGGNFLSIFPLRNANENSEQRSFNFFLL